MHAQKKLLYLFAKDIASTHTKIHLGLLLDLSAKDMAIELIYVYKHAYAGKLTYSWNCMTATKDKAHV